MSSLTYPLNPLCPRARFLDLVEGRADIAGMTKMRDVALRGQEGVSAERTVNKIQDFVWDETLGGHCTLPQVRQLVVTVPSLTPSPIIDVLAEIFSICLFMGCSKPLWELPMDLGKSIVICNFIFAEHIYCMCIGEAEYK